MADILAIDLAEKLNAGEVHVLDVRDTLEFSTFNIGGTHIPLGKLPHMLDDLDWDESDEIIVVCQHGVRSKTACQVLNHAGYTNVRNLKGGIVAYRRAMN